MKNPKNCSLIELKKKVKINKKELKEKLNQYFMNRSIELKNKDFDFYTVNENGEEIN